MTVFSHLALHSNRVCGVATPRSLAAQILQLEATDIVKKTGGSDSVYIFWLKLPLLLTLAWRQVQFKAQPDGQDLCWWLKCSVIVSVNRRDFSCCVSFQPLWRADRATEGRTKRPLLEPTGTSCAPQGCIPDRIVVPFMHPVSASGSWWRSCRADNQWKAAATSQGHISHVVGVPTASGQGPGR